MAKVNPQFAPGLCCPRCGRPLTWVGHWRRDHNSPDGQSFLREPFTFITNERVSPRDKPVTQVTPNGAYELKTEQKFEHTCTLQCSRCSWIGNESQAVHKQLSDDELRTMHLYHSYYFDAE